MIMNIIIGILIPFIGTVLGSACVFFLKDKIAPLLQKSLLGFASGVMMAASVWSLLIPAIEMSEHMGKLSFIPAVVGLGLGILFLLVMDRIIPHLHLHSDEPEGMKSKLKKDAMLVLAVTLHNIPDGAIISLPLKSEGSSKGKAFLYGTLSGIVEPIGAIITILLSEIVMSFLPYLLSFAAGAMIYVVIEELIPEASEGEHSNIATIGFAVGFMIMMTLDVALG